MRFSFLFFIALGIMLVFYLSWVPSPDMQYVWFLPDWVARWADVRQNGDLRTAVPFVFLGFCSGILLLRSQAAWFWWLVACFGLTIVAAIAEVGQLALPHRHFSWADIRWGTAGSVLGLVSALVVGFVSRQFRIGNQSE